MKNEFKLFSSFGILHPLIVKNPYEVIDIEECIPKDININLDSDVDCGQSGDGNKALKLHMLKFIKNLPIFQDVDENDLEKLTDTINVLHYCKGETIAREGELSTDFYIIEKGLVKINKNLHSGKGFITSLLSQGEVMGQGIVWGRPLFATVTAMKDTCLFAIRGKTFLEFVCRNPNILLKIGALEKEIFDKFCEKMIDLTTNTVEYRLIKLLASLACKYGNVLHFTHQDIAEMSLTTLETTARVFSRLKILQIITQSRGKIVVIDYNKLRSLEFQLSKQ